MSQSLSESQTAPQSDSSFRWVVCALLFLATTINYMDRQILGLLAPILQPEIGWNEIQYGRIVIAFQSAYALGLLSFGYLIDRWGVKRGYSLAIVVWSIAACLHAMAGSVMGFAGARFLLGIGESGNFPSAIKAVAEHFKKSERALATGIFNSGSTIGAIIAPAMVPAIAQHFGWRAAFIAVGSAGFAWVILWSVLYRPSNLAEDDATDAPLGSPNQPLPPAELDDQLVAAAPRIDSTAEDSKYSWAHLLTLRQTWAFNFISAMGQPVGWFFLFWLPKFFNKQYGLDITKVGTSLVLVYSMALVGSICGGLYTPFLLKRGFSLNASRKGALLVCVLLMIPVCFATLAPNALVAALMIGLGMFALQGWAANCYTVVSDLFPKRAIGTIVGLGSACGSIVSIAYAALAGHVLQSTNNYTSLFVIAGLACPLGLLVLHILVPRWEPAKL